MQVAPLNDQSLGLSEFFIKCLDEEGLMDESAETRICKKLDSIDEKFTGTNGQPGVFTRLSLIEDHLGKSATLWRHAKAVAIGVLITVPLTFFLSRTLAPNWSPDAERIQALEQKLRDAEQKIEAQDNADDQTEVAQPVKIKVPKRTNKPRRSQPGPLIQQYKHGDILTTSAPVFPIFGYNRNFPPAMEFPK